MFTIWSRLMGISALKTVSRNIENSIEKQEFWPFVFCHYLGTYTIFLKCTFVIGRYFKWKKFKFTYIFCEFFTVFRRFLCEFPIFLKRGSALKFPLTATEKCAQRWQYKANDKCWSKKGTKRNKVQLRNFLLDYYLWPLHNILPCKVM